MSLQELVKLKNAHHARAILVVGERNSRIYLLLSVASIFARFESSWFQHVGNTAKEGVQKRASLIWTNETATENKTGQAGSRRQQPFVSVIVSRSRSVMCVLDILQYFAHAVIKWIQICRIWRPQLRLDTFWSFFL